jgi:hypothetical protein
MSSHIFRAKDFELWYKNSKLFKNFLTNQAFTNLTGVINPQRDKKKCNK